MLEFVQHNALQIEDRMTEQYHQITGKSLEPGSPELLILKWAASIFSQAYAAINSAALQNVPAYATGEALDNLAQLFGNTERLPASNAVCTIKFTISTTQSNAIVIPIGTRVTNSSNDVVFATAENVAIMPGETNVSVLCICQTPGEEWNGIAVGQLTSLIDIFPYYSSCQNTDVSSGGSDAESDAALRVRLKEAMFGLNTAGSKEAYEYLVRSASPAIIDAKAISTDAGEISIYAITEDGAVSSSVKSLITNHLSGKVPLGDQVIVDDPDAVSYSVSATYYVYSDCPVPMSEIEAAVEEAVNKYVEWQGAKLGRDINPSKLAAAIMSTGYVKRFTGGITGGYVELTDGSDGETPEYASISGTPTLTNGGYEDE